uniref:Selenoprotein F/M domain-containing protein n=1 Tax=Chromera velia CCMP2878 TaxID=1169474 RepID=A0A0G4HPM9_9ALVE|eukprot:Cvel_7847.t1-p1 / transcript=Cvel_7847.t1 / gene=Cvel_7847 / organism=Chromera_velia_CCMP2878 / gene_product=hypothetical protein / transcript_product=hypothetical protein / location=Cvel_scaffold420:13816-17242(+) / protein_length=350 / sequence_SO=supercontig / SO=protein_coding / is_pseudo=false
MLNLCRLPNSLFLFFSLLLPVTDAFSPSVLKFERELHVRLPYLAVTDRPRGVGRGRCAGRLGDGREPVGVLRASGGDEDDDDDDWFVQAYLMEEGGGFPPLPPTPSPSPSPSTVGHSNATESQTSTATPEKTAEKAEVTEAEAGSGSLDVQQPASVSQAGGETATQSQEQGVASGPGPFGFFSQLKRGGLGGEREGETGVPVPSSVEGGAGRAQEGGVSVGIGAAESRASVQGHAQGQGGDAFLLQNQGGEEGGSPVEILIRYTGGSGLKPYFIASSRIISDAFPPAAVSVSREVMQQKSGREEAGAFEIWVDGAQVYQRKKKKKAVYLEMEVIRAAVERAAKRRRRTRT